MAHLIKTCLDFTVRLKMLYCCLTHCFYLLGMNFSPLFPSNFGDFSQNVSTSTEQQQPLAQNSSGKTEYMAFPKPFESSSSIGAEKQR